MINRKYGFFNKGAPDQPGECHNALPDRGGGSLSVFYCDLNPAVQIAGP